MLENLIYLRNYWEILSKCWEMLSKCYKYLLGDLSVCFVLTEGSPSVHASSAGWDLRVPIQSIPNRLVTQKIDLALVSLNMSTYDSWEVNNEIEAGV